MFFAQFTEFMIVLLMAAAVIAGVVGEPEDAVVILAIVVLNAVIGFVEEYRAEPRPAIRLPGLSPRLSARRFRLASIEAKVC